MRMVSAGRISEDVLAALGWSAAAYTLTGKDRSILTRACQQAVNRVYSRQKWPQLRRVEYRTFRPPWSSTVTYVAGNEVWVLDPSEDAGGAYYRLLAATSLNEDPLESDATVWERVTDLIPFVQFVQPWETYAIDPEGLDCKAFAYASDPRGNPELKPIAGCYPYMESVMLPKGEATPSRVWVIFIPERPRLDFTEWTAGTYAQGDARFKTSTGRCYVSLEDGNTEDPDGSDKWTEIGVPEMFREYVTLYCVGQWLDADHGAATAQRQAEAELERLERAHFEAQGAGSDVCFDVGR